MYINFMYMYVHVCIYLKVICEGISPVDWLSLISMSSENDPRWTELDWSNVLSLWTLGIATVEVASVSLGLSEN